MLLTAAVGPLPCVAAVVPGAIELALLDVAAVGGLLSGVPGAIELALLDAAALGGTLSGVPGTIELVLLDAAALGGRFSGVPGAARVVVGILFIAAGGAGFAASFTPVADGTFLSAGADRPPLEGRNGGLCTPLPVVLLRDRVLVLGLDVFAVDGAPETGRRGAPLTVGVVFLRPSRGERTGEVTAAALGGCCVLAVVSSDIITGDVVGVWRSEENEGKSAATLLQR